jgi:two-component system, NarL family, nitrate/nitrite response regulator NarL
MRGHVLRILIADDHPVLLAGVRRVLELDGGFEVVAEVHSGPEVFPMVGQAQPDVVLLDVRMPGLDGLTCLDRLRAGYPDVQVVMCSMGSDPDQIQSAFARGACGYIVKSVDPNDLASAIREAVEGTAFHAHGLPGINEDSAGLAAGLTTREIEIMEAVARGLANKAIAKELWITEQTVKFHLTNIYRKLDLSNRTELATWAFSHGLKDHEYEDIR